MEMVRKVEDKLADLFKDLPALPKNVKETLAQVWPWLALIFGLLQVAAAWGLWRLMDTIQQVDQAYGYLAQYVQITDPISSTDKVFIWVGIAVLIVNAVILLMAFAPLKARLRKGWDLIFLGALLNVVYSVISIFIEGRGFGTFVVSLLGSAVTFYLLFQVREKFGGKQPATSAKK